MRTVFTALLACVAVCSISQTSFSASVIEAQSTITSVTVYPDSVLVTRNADVKLDPGEYSIIFSDIIPDIDDNSLRVSSGNNLSLKLFGAQVKKEFLKDDPAEKIKQLKLEIQKLNDEMRSFQNQINLLMEEKSFLDSLRLFSSGQIPKDLITKVPTSKELDDILVFLDSRLKSNYAAVMENEVKIRELRIKIDALQKELAQISGFSEKIKRSIVVDVQAVKSGNAMISVSYLVRGNASWQPLYDARAFFDKNEVELVSHGIVSQTTGEDWDDVEMVLSTAKPSTGGTLPYVSPWILRPYQPRPLQVRKMAYKAEVMDAMQSRAFEEDKGLAGANAPDEGAPVYATAEDRGIAVAYKLPKKVTVKSDGTEHKLPVSIQTLKADFMYSTYPRLVPSAFLGSRVTNSNDLQLLSGRVNVFLEGDFVGTSAINNIGPGEEFDLYLGADDNVKIKRECVEKKVDETIIANIPSPVRKTQFKYKLTAENYKSKKIKIKLFEAMPVPEDDRIKVKINQVSMESKKKDWEDRKGVWLWEVELEPKAKQEIIYSFTVEHPRDMRVEGLD